MSFMFMLAIVSLTTSGKNINTRTQQDVRTEQFPYLYRCMSFNISQVKECHADSVR